MMFACLYQPSSQQNLFGFGLDADRRDACPAERGGRDACPAEGAIERLAHEFSPRVEAHRPDLVSLDIAGLGRLLGTPGDIASELQRSAGERGLHLRIAVAPTRTAAMLLALAGRPEAAGGGPQAGGRRREAAGVIVAPPGREREMVAALPLGVLRQLPFAPSTLPTVRVAVGGRGAEAPRLQLPRLGRADASRRSPGPADSAPSNADEVVALLRRWGLKTLGELAGLPSRPLSERLGQHGVMWQRLARGEDLQPLIAREAEAPIEEALDLEWPVEGLEPLSFVLARICEPLTERLGARDLAAAVLHLSFRLVSRETEIRELQLPAPMRDPKVLRTLILLHLESHPLPGGVDRVALRVDAAPARITQFSLLARARPFPEQMATLLARLSALLGERRAGAATLVDSHRPGAFAMTGFSGGFEKAGASPGDPVPDGGAGVPPAGPRVALRRFRTPVPARVIVQDGRPVRVTMERRGLDGGTVTAAAGPWRTSGEWWLIEKGSWSRDEWDVALSDGALYRVFRDRTADRWFVDGIVD